MITLQGTLRQSGVNEYEGKKKTRVWVEHTSPRDDGPDDLKLEEFWFDGDLTSTLPKPGTTLSVVVRPYTVGKGVKYAAISIVPQPAQPARAA
jgi:hypothetical protein